jgi:glycerol uptake facilitator-like aquaporin
MFPLLLAIMRWAFCSSSVTAPGYIGSPSATASHLPTHLNSWERFGVEFILTFIVVFTYFVSMDTYRKWLGSSALTVGSAYLACTLVSVSLH